MSRFNHRRMVQAKLPRRHVAVLVLQHHPKHQSVGIAFDAVQRHPVNVKRAVKSREQLAAQPFLPCPSCNPGNLRIRNLRPSARQLGADVLQIGEQLCLTIDIVDHAQRLAQ
jgi:hypothetical protein